MAASLYRHFDSSGVLLYVGISKSALARLAQHANGAGWFSAISTVSIEHFASRDEAASAERIAIINEGPKYNIQHINAELEPKAKARPGRPALAEGQTSDRINVRLTLVQRLAFEEAGGAQWLRRQLDALAGVGVNPAP